MEAYQISMSMPSREIRVEYARVRASSKRHTRAEFDERAGALVGEKPTPGMWLAAARRMMKEDRDG
jgi:hypothetical protein